MTAPGLVITDASGDTLTLDTSPAGNLTLTVDEDGPACVLLDRSQARQLFRWLSAWLGESQLGYARCDRCSVLFDPVTGHHCYAGDDEQVRGWLAGEGRVGRVGDAFAHAGPCGPGCLCHAPLDGPTFPPAVSKSAPDAERRPQ
jgi:hypothetical protein